MKNRHLSWVRFGAAVAGVLLAASALLSPARAQAPAPAPAPAQQQKPNILFIMGDDIGWMQVGIYHRGLANHLGDHTDALPTAHGFQEYWGYLYHLDAMQGVSFPDINKSPTQQTVAPPCKNTPIPGLSEVPGAVDPKMPAR